MNLQERAQQHAQQRQRQGRGGQEQSSQTNGTTQFFHGSQQVYGIVDNQIVEVLGVTDIPGNSLSWICADPQTGINAPVPYDEVRVFKSLSFQGLQQLMQTETAQQSQSGSTRSR